VAVLLYSEISDRALDRIQANVATDPPFTAAEIGRHINEAYADVFEISGGGVLQASHAAVWTVNVSGIGSFVNSVLHTISEIVTCCAAVAGSTTCGKSTDVPLDRVEFSKISALRAAAGLGSYLRTKVYSIRRLDSATPGDIPSIGLDVWPYVAADFFPVDYIPLFQTISAAGVTTPSVSDIESRDISLLAAARMAPLIGRAELVPSIIMDVSERTKKALDRKLSALLDARQDR